MDGKTKAQVAFATGFSSELICKGYKKSPEKSMHRMNV